MPDTEYVIVSVARNRFLQHTEDVAVSESFSTKPIVIDNPSASMAKVSVKLSDPTRTTFKASYQYNEETALYYHQMVLDKTKIDDYLSGANPERLINWLSMYGTDQTNSTN